MKKMLLIMLAVTVSVAMITAATMAWFTAQDDAGDATFTAGTLKINVTDGVSQVNELATIDHMNPGDTFGPITIEIENTGTKNLAWFGDWQFDYKDRLGHVDGDKLLDALYIKSMKMEFLDEKGNSWFVNEDCRAYGDEWYRGDYFIENGVGKTNRKENSNVIYNQGQADWFNSLKDTNFEVITLRNFNDNNDMITLPGMPYEHMGALKPGNKYKLTVEIGFHQDAGNEYQGDRKHVSPIKVGFNVNATQVKADAINKEIGEGIGTAHIEWFEAQIDAQPDN